jgi:hypothetical protein
MLREEDVVRVHVYVVVEFESVRCREPYSSPVYPWKSNLKPSDVEREPTWSTTWKSSLKPSDVERGSVASYQFLVEIKFEVVRC